MQRPLPFDAPLAAYQHQAAAILAGHAAANPETLTLIHRHHPRFLEEKVPWLPKRIDAAMIAREPFDLDAAQLTLARTYNFLDWPALEEHVHAVARHGSVWRFEQAVEAVIDGGLATLEQLLAQDPDLVHARSQRRTHFDPAVHRGTLLHYVAANGVENYRQRTPANAVAIATMLLDSGAQVDSLADLYGTRCTTMSLLVSSGHPAAAGVQGPLVNLLLDRGAAIEGLEPKKWGSPLLTSLVFGCMDAADALVRRGAHTGDLVIAAGLGHAHTVRRLLPHAAVDQRQRALSLAAQRGHAEVITLLLEAGADPNRYNAEGFHAHSTPLHQAVWGGHRQAVRALVEHGARLDLEDKIYRSTPIGWANYSGKTEIEAYLRAKV